MRAGLLIGLILGAVHWINTNAFYVHVLWVTLL